MDHDIKKILENNENKKADMAEKLNDTLKKYQNALRKINTFYINLCTSNPDDPRIPAIQKNVWNVKRKVIKIKQLIKDYEKVEW